MAKSFMFPNPCLSGRYRDTVMYSVKCTLQFHTCDICHVRISHYYYKNPTFPGPVEYLHRAYMWEDITMHLSWLARILGSQYSWLYVTIFPPSNCRLFNWFSHRIWTIHSIAWNLHKHIYLSICIYLALLDTNSAHFVLVNKMGCSIY